MNAVSDYMYRGLVAPVLEAVSAPVATLSVGQQSQVVSDSTYQTQQEIQNRAALAQIMRTGMEQYDVMDPVERRMVLSLPGVQLQTQQTQMSHTAWNNPYMFQRHTQPLCRTSTRTDRMPLPNFSRGGIADTRAENAVRYGSARHSPYVSPVDLNRDLERRFVVYNAAARDPMSSRQEDYVDAMPNNAWTLYGAPARQMIRGDETYAYSGPTGFTNAADEVHAASPMVHWSSGSARK